MHRDQQANIPYKNENQKQNVWDFVLTFLLTKYLYYLNFCVFSFYVIKNVHFQENLETNSQKLF